MSGFVVINKTSLEKLNFDKNSFTLDEPSIVHAQFSKNDVKAFIQEDNNLVIKLKDGQVILIENFFEISAEAIPSDLVFNDDACSFLWFEFTDGIARFKPLLGLEELLPVVASSQGMGILPWVGGGLLLAGLAAAGGGGGKGDNSTSSPKDESNPPSIPTVATVIENKSLVTEGESIVITVKLTGKTTDTTAYSYDVSGTATPIDDYGTPTFSHGVTQKTGQIIVPKGVDEFTIIYVTNVDDIQEPALTGDPNETLVVVVGGEKVEVQIKDQDIESVDPSIPSTSLPIVKAIQVSPATVEEGETLVYTIILSKETTTATPYSYSIFGTATPVIDFDYPIFSELGITFNGIDQIIIPAGVSSFTISYPTIRDGKVEADETLILKIADIEVTGVITDPSKPSIETLTALSPIVDEGGILIFTVTLSSETQQEYKYQYSTSGDSTVMDEGYAQAGEDYGAAEFSHGVRLVNGQLLVPKGVNEFTIQYKTNVDHFDEGSERLDIALEDKTASAFILDILHPPIGAIPPTVESVSVVGGTEIIPVVTEGESIVVTVKLTGTTTETTTYSYVIGGTATPIDDYGTPIFSHAVSVKDGQLIVPEGVNEFTITYYTNIDHEVEPLDPVERYETIDLTVGGVGITVGIQDSIQDTNPPAVEVAKVVSVELLNPIVIEGEDFIYTVRFDKPTTADNSPYSFILDTVGATLGLDFGQAIFEDERIKYNGQNQILVSKDIQEFIIKIPTYKDNFVDSGEIITLEVGGVSAEMGTILDPLKPSVTQIDMDSSSVVEGNELIFKVYLSDLTPQQSTYTYTVSGDSIVDEIGYAKVWEDYGAPIFSHEVTLVNGQLIVPAGVQSFEIRYITNLDSKVEGEEKLIITIDDISQFGIIQDPNEVSTPNTAPHIITDKIVLDEDDEVSDRIDAIDAEGHALTYVVKDNVSHGVLVLDSLTGKYTYKPHKDFHGVDQFTITVKDSKGAETDAVISITVNSINDAPIFDKNLLGTDIANPLNVLENSSTLLNGQVTATDVDLPNDVLTYSTTSTSEKGGELKIDSVTGRYTYKPQKDYAGPDQFTVTVTDHDGLTDRVTIYINITATGNEVPTAVDDSAITLENTLLIKDALHGLLGNDSDADGDTLTIVRVDSASNKVGQVVKGSAGGEFIIYADGSYSFNPKDDFDYLQVGKSQSTSITYTINDGKNGYATATFTVTVQGENDVPVIELIQISTNEDTLVKGKVSAIDIDQDELTYTVIEGTKNGEISVDLETGEFVYKPKENFYGSDSVTIKVEDSHGGVATVIIPITVYPINDAPLSEGDTYQVVEGTNKHYASVLINDKDIENTILKIAQFSANSVTSGQIANGINSITTLLGGTVTMNADGTFIYKAPVIKHTTEYVEDSFYYQATDGEASSAWTKVVLNVQDSTPLAQDDFTTVGIGDVVSGNLLQGTIDGREIVSGVDILSADAPNRIESISLNNTTYNIAETGTTTIHTENGSLTINSHGDYSYASKYQNIYIDRSGSNTAPILVNWKDQSQGGVKGIYGFEGSSSLFNSSGSLQLLNLNDTAAGYVRYRDMNGINNDGLGVHVSSYTGSENNNRVELNEFIVFDLGSIYKNAVVTLTDVTSSTEAGRITWYAFDALGKPVANGLLNDSSVSIIISNGIATVALPKDLKYQYIALSSTHTNAHFRINGLKAEIDTGLSSLKDEFSYILKDADGSQSTAQLVVETSKNPIAFNDSNVIHEGGLENGSLFGIQQTTILGNLFANDNISNGSQITTITMKSGVSGSSQFTTDGTIMTLTDHVGQLEVNIFTGEYSYTLFNATSSGVDDVKTFEYTFKDGVTEIESNSAELTINIIDDTPSANPINKELTTSPYPQTYNLVITLDVSGSMSMDAAGNYSGTNGFDVNTIRLALAKAGIEQLIHSFDQLGNVNVKIISFSSSNSEEVSEWFIDNKTSAIQFVNSQQADGGTAYNSAIQKVMDSWTGIPAADKTFVYFISDGTPDSGSAVTGTLQTTWQNFIETQKVDDVFAIGMGTAGTSNLLPIASKPENAIVIKTPTELADTLLSTIDQGVVLGNVSILSQQGSTSGLLLGADGGQLTSVIVDGKTYYAAQGVQQRILTQKGGQLDINFNTGAYQYTMVVNKTIKNQVEAIVVNAVDGDGDAVILPLNITLNYSAYIDANRDTIITNIAKGQSITISDKALLHNDKLTEVTKLSQVENAKNGSVAGTATISYTTTSTAATIPSKTIQVIEESIYRNGTVWSNNDTSSAPKNNILGLAVDFTDRSQFGNTGNAGTVTGSVSGSTISGWAVDNGINGYTKVLNGSLVNNDIDFVKVYLYAGERIYIDVDGVTGANTNPSNTITRAVFNTDGSSTGFSQTSDGWFNASTTGEYYIRLNSSNTTSYNLVLTIDNGTSTAGAGTSTAPKGWIGDASGSFEYVLTDNSIGENINTKATADIYYVSGTTLNGTRGDDILVGAETNDLLYGGLGNDVLLGGLGNDTLWGGEGNDLLIGGQGNDILYGGSGQDIFSWDSSAQGNDEIMDFKIGEDKIDIQGLLQDLGWDKAGEIDITEFVRLTESANKTILEFHQFESTTIDTTITIDKITGQGSLQDWINSGHIVIG